MLTNIEMSCMKDLLVNHLNACALSYIKLEGLAYFFSHDPFVFRSFVEARSFFYLKKKYNEICTRNGEKEQELRAVELKGERRK